MLKKNFYDKYKYLTVSGVCSQGEVTWMIDGNTNSLYRLDEASEKLQFIANLEANDKYVETEFTHMVENNGALFMLPQNTYFICVYNICSGELNKIELPCGKDGFGYGVIGEVMYQGYLYIFSCYEKYAPCKINLASLEIEEEQEWRVELQKLNFPRNTYLLSRVILENDRIIFGIYNTQFVMSYMLTTKKMEKVCRLKEDFNIDKVICNYQNNIYLSAAGRNEIYRINLKDDSQERMSVAFWKKDDSVINVLNCGTDTYLLPKFGNAIVKFHVSGQNLEKVKWDVPELEGGDPERWFFCGYPQGQKLFLYLYKKGSRLKIDLESGSTVLECLDKNPGKTALEILKHDYWEQLEGESMGSYSEEICPLDVYISRKFTSSQDGEDTQSSIGSSIWRTLTED